MLRDNEIRIDTGRAIDGGTFVRIVHLPTGRTRTADRLGAEAHAAAVSRLRVELEADLLASGLVQFNAFSRWNFTSATGSPTRPESGRSSAGRTRRTPARTLTPASGRWISPTSRRSGLGRARARQRPTIDLRRIRGWGGIVVARTGSPVYIPPTSYTENLWPLYCHLTARKRTFAGTLYVMY